MEKILVVPNFETLFLNEPKNFYIIGITDQSKGQEKEIMEIVDNGGLDNKVSLHNDVLTLEAKDALYSFNLKEYLQGFLQKLDTTDFYIAFSFLDQNLQPKDLELKGIKFQLQKQ